MTDESYPRCEKCGGKILREGSEYRCLNCGKEYQTNRQKKVLYSSWEVNIKKDLETMEAIAVRKKYQIPPGTFTQLLQQWAAITPTSPVPVRTPVYDGHLPGLPAFSDTWPEKVQLKWLETYLAILIHGVKGGKVNEQDNQGGG